MEVPDRIKSPLELPVGELKGVGAKRSALFAKLGVKTLYDLLRYYPRSYLDFSSPLPISDAPSDTPCCTRAIVAGEVREQMIRRGMTLYKCRVADDTGICELTFFNNRYIKSLLKQGEEYIFYGLLTGSGYHRKMASPEFEKAEDFSGLRPIYPQTEGLSSRQIRSAIEQALGLCCDHLTDPLPDSLRQQQGLCHLRYALENIHLPKTRQDLDCARDRLAFEELLYLQLGLLTLREQNKSRRTAASCIKPADFTEFYAHLPYTPTGAQTRAIKEAAADMGRETAMNRLLQGDVGSGKTLVAAAICYYAWQNGYQSALMAPTEILAAQHHRSLSALLEPLGMRVGLLTGSLSASEKQGVKAKLASQELDLIVGTHALLQGDVVYRNPGLVITDEQHRFGVAHRAMLSERGQSPHVLVMSATPIPRTLALILYGDLDISTLYELPKGRQKIETYLVDSGKRKRIYRFIRNHIEKGRQAYIVCPLVEQNENSPEELSDVESYAKKIASEDLAGCRVGLLHGRLKPAQKDEMMRAFASGELDVLVATTVIEVGVDVPNAVVMVIENAERFGLSQLHQLRGRVGRGSEQSTCILISDSHSKETLERLKTLRDNNDGFAIAEKDLQLRGPGDFFGRRQHGLPELRVADLVSDLGMLRRAQQVCNELLENDPRLESHGNESLRKAVQALFREEVVFN